jgi:hypothetical protein
MSSAKLIVAAVVLAAAVFLITFAMAFIRTPPAPVKPPTTGPDEAALTFPDGEAFPKPPEKSSDPQAKPEPMPSPAIGEMSVPGGDLKEYTHDFWFKNAAGKDLPLSLKDKNCQCTFVYVYLAPEDVASGIDGNDPAERERVRSDVEARVQPVNLLSENAKTVVPAGGVGWIRLKWSSDHEGAKRIAVQLWVGDKGVGRPQQLTVGAYFLKPLMVENSVKDLTAEDELSTSDLPKTFYVRCWSPTRPQSEFPLKAGLVHSRLEAEKAQFAVGELVAMTKEELAALRASGGDGPPVPAASGWKVPVTLLARSPDGSTAFEMGRFAQWLRLSLDDFPEALEVFLLGQVSGGLTASEEGVVDFKTFYRTRESPPKTIDVSGEADTTKLTVDPRTASFLTVDLAKTPRDVGSRKVWTVTLRVKANEVSGKFPNKDDPLLRDCAIYLRAERSGEADSACIRIPVIGTANDPKQDNR